MSLSLLRSNAGSTPPRATGRRRPAMLRALGDSDLPGTVSIAGREYRLLETFKHDSWAATGLYSCEGKLAICKFNRQQSIAGIPMGWLGRWLGSRERQFLRRLNGIVGVPAELGQVAIAGKSQPNAIAREFIAGEILRPDRNLPPDFFARFRKLLADVHGQNVAYVDLHKAENVLVGEDGFPYLFDFQISFALPSGPIGRTWPFRWWLTCLQRSDDYHLLKHEMKHRPGGSQAQVDQARPWWIRLHRLVGVPIRAMRRRLLVALGVRSGLGSATSEEQPEVAFRELKIATSSENRAA